MPRGPAHHLASSLLKAILTGKSCQIRPLREVLSVLWAWAWRTRRRHRRRGTRRKKKIKKRKKTKKKNNKMKKKKEKEQEEKGKKEKRRRKRSARAWVATAARPPSHGASPRYSLTPPTCVRRGNPLPLPDLRGRENPPLRFCVGGGARG